MSHFHTEIRDVWRCMGKDMVRVRGRLCCRVNLPLTVLVRTVLILLIIIILFFTVPISALSTLGKSSHLHFIFKSKFQLSHRAVTGTLLSDQFAPPSNHILRVRRYISFVIN